MEVMFQKCEEKVKELLKTDKTDPSQYQDQVLEKKIEEHRIYYKVKLAGDTPRWISNDILSKDEMVAFELLLHGKPTFLFIHYLLL